MHTFLLFILNGAVFRIELRFYDVTKGVEDMNENIQNIKISIVKF